MGAGLEMRTGSRTLILCAVMLSLLAGCSNEQARLDLRGLARDALRGLTGSAAGGAAEATPLAAPAEVLAAIDGPVALMQTETGDRLYVLGVSDNGPYRTFATATGQTLTLRNGMITNTRGLGQDVMASEAGPVLALLSKGIAGQAQRRFEVLDGEDRTRVIALDCTITQGATDLSGLTSPLPAGRPMTETCAGHHGDARGLAFTNLYLLDQTGRIILSRQWLPSMTGAVTLQILRH